MAQPFMFGTTSVPYCFDSTFPIRPADCSAIGLPSATYANSVALTARSLAQLWFRWCQFTFETMCVCCVIGWDIVPAFTRIGLSLVLHGLAPYG